MLTGVFAVVQVVADPPVGSILQAGFIFFVSTLRYTQYEEDNESVIFLVACLFTETGKWKTSKRQLEKRESPN